MHRSVVKKLNLFYSGDEYLTSMLLFAFASSRPSWLRLNLLRLRDEKMDACGDVYFELATHCPEPYSSNCAWDDWDCTIESPSDGHWRFDCHSNSSWVCEITKAPDPVYSYVCSGSCSGPEMKLSTLQIAGIGIFCAALVVAGIIGYCWYRRRRARRMTRQDTRTSDEWVKQDDETTVVALGALPEKLDL
jgi:hypothetical protein